MSSHLIGCVKNVKGIGKSHKLALIAFADSADDDTHIGFPGNEGVMEWAVCSKSRAGELIADLVDAGLLKFHRAARPSRRGVPGRRAEYVVFPNGCCEHHKPKPVATEPTTSVEQVLAGLEAAGVTLTREQLAALTPTTDPEVQKRSEISDQFTSENPEISDVIEQEDEKRSEISNEVQKRSENLGPFTSRTTTPPSPRQRGATSTTVCQRHGTTPQPNCRGCGTTQRQIDAQAAADAAERRRRADQAAIEADRARKDQRLSGDAIRRHLEQVGLR